jgi:hypothetical protein
MRMASSICLEDQWEESDSSYEDHCELVWNLHFSQRAAILVIGVVMVSRKPSSV